MLDLIIKNGTIIDGTGREKFVADLGVRGEKIVCIGNLQDEVAEKIIDAQGKFVTPGFIDPHSHADLNLLIWPENEGNVMQGITTTIGGNCGFSPAPLKNLYLFSAWEFRLLHEIYPQYYNDMQVFIDLKKMKKKMKELYDYDVDYENMEGFFKKAEDQGFSVNLYPFVGHNTIRTAVLGRDCERAATEEELEKMKALLRQEMEAGCRGLSTGLDYIGSYGTTEEIIELAKVAKEYGGIYVTHFRQGSNVTEDDNLGVLKGIKEVIRIGKEAGIQVNLSHMFPAFQLYRNDPLEKKIEAAQIIKDLINQARREGLQISYDVMPNVSGGGSSNPNLIRFFRPWIMAAGSTEQFIYNLSVPDYVDALKREAKTGKWEWLILKDWPLDEMICIIKSTAAEFENKTVRMIMQEKEWEFIDALIEICKADPDTKMRFDVGTLEEFLQVILDDPYAMPCSDGLSFNQDSEVGLEYPLNVLPHPNNFCYTIRFLTLYKKDRIEDTIRALTGLPAEIFHLRDRGFLEEGKYADIVVMTLDKLAPNENFIEPRTFPDGIDYVIINGQITAHNKQHTGVKAGKILKNK
ncbi:MAG: N-acyl-D-amino-acid deacylase family protein [Promethearchaeota archaeon]